MRTRPFEIGVVLKRSSLEAVLAIIAKIVNPAALLVVDPVPARSWLDRLLPVVFADYSAGENSTAGLRFLAVSRW
jgi:hypothetical protein